MPEPQLNPAFLRTRREAGWILVAWAVCLVWTVGFSAWAAYPAPGEQVPLLFGMPAWVVGGVLVPWLLATGFSVWFGLVYMQDGQA